MVKGQKVGVVNLAAWDGDGISSGLVGLAFPSLTSAYPGTNVSADNQTMNAVNPSIIDTIFEIQNLTASMFTLALSRDESNNSYGGVIAIGGVPSLADPSINASSSFVSTPIEILITQFIDPGTSEYQFYTINIIDIVYGDTNTVALPSTEFIVDSGTTLLYVTTSQAIDYNSQYDRPTSGYDETGVFFVSCTATTPPPFAVTIAGEAFPSIPST